MIGLPVILLSLYALLRLILLLDLVDETAFLSAGSPALCRVDTPIPKLVEVKFWRDYWSPRGR